MGILRFSESARLALQGAEALCRTRRHEYQTPEHLLEALLEQHSFVSATKWFNDCSLIQEPLRKYLDSLYSVPEDQPWELVPSTQSSEVLAMAVSQVAASANSDSLMLTVPHLVYAMLQLEDSLAAYLIGQCAGDDLTAFMTELIESYASEDGQDGFGEVLGAIGSENAGEEEQPKSSKSWHQLVTCLNDTYQRHNPLIGRSQELDRTIQVLCRKEKNNPLHVGEPGVGKTALVYGLVERIVRGDVPQRLRNSRVYQLDMGNLLAGTTYRGDFEKRIKQIMDGAEQEKGTILYIDEIHNLVGSGAQGNGVDGAHIMMPYMERGDIRFIGSTTYEQQKRQMSKNPALMRRFHQIDIAEPTLDETKEILRQLRPLYEQFHGVTIDDEAVSFAVEASAKHINDRFLPDKAIDLLDEAGAALQLHNAQRPKTVDKQLIAEILAKTCKVDALAIKADDDQRLESISERILARVYGQDEAVRQVVEAVQMSKAGLTDDQKPLSSLLFVGPTGVGKTEVARVLAQEMGVGLVRFDMSEYVEKHTVSKLIGSPVGYLGYEDGGLLVDAIRKTPNCVLLLDEIEKAHADVFNILLQVMDYATLTDNHGRKADFRNVVIIMTSNAGAQYASQASIGFTGKTSRGEAMLQQVRKTFKPEFINRLSGTVVFHDMDRTMASLILRKKVGELQTKLKARQVEMTLSDEAFERLLDEGFTREYGAREMDRVIGQRLKPLLMREILFGSLKNGGEAVIDVNDGTYGIRVR